MHVSTHARPCGRTHPRALCMRKCTCAPRRIKFIACWKVLESRLRNAPKHIHTPTCSVQCYLFGSCVRRTSVTHTNTQVYKHDVTNALCPKLCMLTTWPFSGASWLLKSPLSKRQLLALEPVNSGWLAGWLQRISNILRWFSEVLIP